MDIYSNNILNKCVVRSDSGLPFKQHNDVVISHVWQGSLLAPWPLFAFFPKQRVGNTREPQCFCVSHSHYDLRSHVFFRLHKLCICWTNEHSSLIELLGELWIAGYCPHQCSDSMSSECALGENDLSGLFGTIFIYTYNKVHRATKCKHTSWAGLCHYTLPFGCVSVCVCTEVCAVIFVCVWSDLLTTIKQTPAVFITCLPNHNCWSSNTYEVYPPLLCCRSLFTSSLLESRHYTMEGNDCGCMLKLFGYQAVPEVCLLGADGQLLQLPASGAGRIEYFLLEDV